MNSCLWLTVPPHGHAAVNIGVLMSSALTTTTQKNSNTEIHVFLVIPMGIESVNHSLFRTKMSCYHIFDTKEEERERSKQT